MRILVAACAAAGIAAFTGDGTNPKGHGGSNGGHCGQRRRGHPHCEAVGQRHSGRKMTMARQSGCFAMAMDIDAAGLPFCSTWIRPPKAARPWSNCKEIAQAAGVPFILKGHHDGARRGKAIEAGAAGIVVSNHGGRVLDDCPATEEVLADIVAAVDGRAKILVDGGIRSGSDVFKGAGPGRRRRKLVARPFVTAVYGGGADGVAAYVEKAGCRVGRHDAPVRRGEPGGHQPGYGQGRKVKLKNTMFRSCKTAETWYSFVPQYAAGRA